MSSTKNYKGNNMGTIVISVNFDDASKAENFLSAVETMLKGLESNITCHRSDDSVIMTATQKVFSTDPIAVNNTSPQTDSPEVAVASPEPAPTMTIPLVTADPISGDTPSALDAPQNDIAPSIVTLKNLSSSYTVPFEIDDMSECSQLSVQNLSPLGESVEFSYASMTYKFPVEKNDVSSICNKNPQFTPTSIRTLADFGDSDPLSVLLKLTEGDTNKVVFGKDIADMVKSKAQNK
jgi:hypothetical protein